MIEVDCIHSYHINKLHDNEIQVVPLKPKQECISVGCVPTVYWPYFQSAFWGGEGGQPSEGESAFWGGSAFRGGLPSEGDLHGDTLSLLLLLALPTMFKIETLIFIHRESLVFHVVGATLPILWISHRVVAQTNLRICDH